MVAVGGSSLACYWLMMRVQSAAARRSNATSDNSGYSSGSTYDSGGWNAFNWFSSDNSSSDNSVASDSSSSGDSGAETVEAVAINATVSAEDDLCR